MMPMYLMALKQHTKMIKVVNFSATLSQVQSIAHIKQMLYY